MKNLFINYDSSGHGGEATSDDPYSSRTPSYTTVKFNQLHRTQPYNKFFYDQVEVTDSAFDKDHLYLAVVRYSDGDTFGTNHGKWYIIGAYETYKEAEDQLKAESEPSLENKGRRSYKPWEGYFNSLEDTEIHVLHVV